jgi:hypothetical protein
VEWEHLRKKKMMVKKKAKKDKIAKEVRDVVAMALLAEIVNCQENKMEKLKSDSSENK